MHQPISSVTVLAPKVSAGQVIPEVLPLTEQKAIPSTGLRVLQISPHPDDELIGAPATLMALRDAGWEIANYAVSLGRSQDWARRQKELEKACRRARFRLILPMDPLPISPDDDLQWAEDELVQRLLRYIPSYDIVFSPSPHDRHHGHEVVARAVRRALESINTPPRWWMWGLWGELPLPNILTHFSKKRLDEIVYALEAHAGELERNDYRRLVQGRAWATSVLGPERVFGFNSRATAGEYAEVVSEVVRRQGTWLLGSARHLNLTTPISDQPTNIDIGFWLSALSLTTKIQLVTKDLLEDLFIRGPSGDNN